VLFFTREFRDIYRGDLSRSRFINVKQAESEHMGEWAGSKRNTVLELEISRHQAFIGVCRKLWPVQENCAINFWRLVPLLPHRGSFWPWIFRLGLLFFAGSRNCGSARPCHKSFC
jgi:hypothetical protein